MSRLIIPLFVLFAATSAFAQKMYWTDTVDNVVRRANLDGSDIVNLVFDSIMEADNNVEDGCC